MIVSRSIHLAASVATMGNFDGIHLGHQALIQETMAHAKALGVPSVVILFEPLPREFFAKEQDLYRIQTTIDKVLKLQRIGVDYVYMLEFNESLSQLNPAQFIDDILKHRLGVKELIVGEDFRFGRARTGSIEDLKLAGITPVIIPAVELQERVSSSRIRELLQVGDFKKAEQLLGEPYRITGRVIHGAKHGRLLGFPTLNIALRKKMPLSGVYAVKVYGLDSQPKIGVANIGRRPTLNPLAHPLLEVYVFDYEGDAYQKRVSIEFIEKVRDEKKFASLDELKAQIAEDIRTVAMTIPSASVA